MTQLLFKCMHGGSDKAQVNFMKTVHVSIHIYIYNLSIYIYICTQICILYGVDVYMYIYKYYININLDMFHELLRNCVERVHTGSTISPMGMISIHASCVLWKPEVTQPNVYVRAYTLWKFN